VLLDLVRKTPHWHVEADITVTAGTNTVTLVAKDNTGNTTTTGYSVSVSGTTGSMTYDANGNLLTNGTKSYEWDAENRLARVLDGSAEVARFKYDAVRRRVEKVAGTTTTTWTYDGNGILHEVGAATSKCIHGPRIDEPLAQEDSAGALTLIHADALGSVTRNSSALGVASGARTYDAWGSFEAGATSGHAFTGREWDPDLGLYYYRARYYDPKAGRFISEDPIAFVGGVNFYAYVENTPANARDSFGLSMTGGYGTLPRPFRPPDAQESARDAAERAQKELPQRKDSQWPERCSSPLHLDMSHDSGECWIWYGGQLDLLGVGKTARLGPTKPTGEG
jgi:RHS repeat-associated protein